MKMKIAYRELLEIGTFEYDAFVSYHEDDRYWVIHQLTRNLECLAEDMLETADEMPDHRLRQCIEDRDFL